MFAGEASTLSVDGGPVPGTAGYGVGDRVLVLVGDTLIPAVIESVSSPAGTTIIEWNVKQHGAKRAYPIPESFLQHDRASPI